MKSLQMQIKAKSHFAFVESALPRKYQYHLLIHFEFSLSFHYPFHYLQFILFTIAILAFQLLLNNTNSEDNTSLHLKRNQFYHNHKPHTAHNSSLIDGQILASSRRTIVVGRELSPQVKPLEFGLVMLNRFARVMPTPRANEYRMRVRNHMPTPRANKYKCENTCPNPGQPNTEHKCKRTPPGTNNTYK